MCEINHLIKILSLDAVEQGKPMNVLFGTVEKTEPLEIRIDQKQLIKSGYLILTNAVRDYKTKFTFDNPNIKQVYTTWDMNESSESTENKIAFKEKIQHEVTIYNGLNKGDKVLLLRVQGGQKFIVLDRLEG